MISALIHIALISAKAVLALIATILILPGLGIAATVWYMRRWRARKLPPRSRLKPSINAMLSATSAEPNIYRIEMIFSQPNARKIVETSCLGQNHSAWNEGRPRWNPFPNALIAVRGNPTIVPCDHYFSRYLSKNAPTSVKCSLLSRSIWSEQVLGRVDCPSNTIRSATTPAARSLRCTLTVLLRKRSRVPDVRIVGGNP